MVAVSGLNKHRKELPVKFLIEGFGPSKKAGHTF
jgi:hypothetical protein